MLILGGDMHSHERLLVIIIICNKVSHTYVVNRRRRLFLSSWHVVRIKSSSKSSSINITLNIAVQILLIAFEWLVPTLLVAISPTDRCVCIVSSCSRHHSNSSSVSVTKRSYISSGSTDQYWSALVACAWYMPVPPHPPNRLMYEYIQLKTRGLITKKS